MKAIQTTIRLFLFASWFATCYIVDDFESTTLEKYFTLFFVCISFALWDEKVKNMFNSKSNRNDRKKTRWNNRDKHPYIND